MKLNLTIPYIKKVAASEIVYECGIQLCDENKITDLNFLKLNHPTHPYEIHSTVEADKPYHPVIFFSKSAIEDARCDCHLEDDSTGYCEHIIAILLKARHLTNKYQHLTWRDGTRFYQQIHAKDLLVEYETRLETPVTLAPAFDCVTIIPKLKFKNQHFYLEASIGATRQYIIKDMRAFVTHAKQKAVITYGKAFTYNHDRTVLDARSAQLFDLIQNLVQDQQDYQSELASDMTTPKALFLSHARFHELFNLYQEELISVKIEPKQMSLMKLTEKDPSLELSIEQQTGGLMISSSLKHFVLYQNQSDFYLMTDTNMSRCSASFVRNIMPILNRIKNQDGTLLIPTPFIPRFLSSVFPLISSVTNQKQRQALLTSYEMRPLHTQVFLDVNDEQVMTATLNFQYKDIEINPLVETNTHYIVRNKTSEVATQQLMQQYTFEPVGTTYQLKNEDMMYQFLKHGLPQLLKNHEVHVTDRVKKLSRQTNKKIHVGVRLESDLMSFKFEDLVFDMSEYQDILAQYKQKKTYHRLKDGSFLALDSTYMSTFFNLVEELALTEADLLEDEIQLSKYRAFYLDRVLSHQQIESTSNHQYQHLLQQFKELKQDTYQIPTTLNATLRPYQEIGFCWLKTLSDYGLSGILADDMGLGKTLQIITLICSDLEKHPRSKPSIIVTPSSLIYNWKAECEKFAPHLRVQLITGNSREREEKIKTVTDYDVIIVSYDVLRRDIKSYDMTFRYVILDEAHHIKNQSTQNAKSVKRLLSEGRFALTGTPLENSIADVWSIFDFILPGYLLSYAAFKKQYEIPITKYQDQTLLNRVHQLVAPFVLRRLKQDVLTELPDKMETIMYCELEPEQQKIYEATLVSMNATLKSELAQQDVHKTRIKMLAMLMRLRQLCCHPALYLENYKHGSAKLNLCLELIQESLEGGHRVLVFSQFTSMFELIAKELDELEIPYFILTGKTSTDERLKLVNHFNEGDVPVFLISLKAGGTGLNLTGADVVIHYDPWWNMSAQNQATDRAYRMGQVNKVQVFKLIAKHTIEEKIEQMQQRKLNLANTLVQEGETFITNLSTEDIQALFTM